MSDNIELINTSSLTALVAHKSLSATAKPCRDQFMNGYFLHVTDGTQHWVASTYLSDKVKHYKKAEALLKDAKQIGFTQVIFEL